MISYLCAFAGHVHYAGRLILQIADHHGVDHGRSGAISTKCLHGRYDSEHQNASAFIRTSVSPPAIMPWKWTECRGSTRAMKNRPTSSLAS